MNAPNSSGRLPPGSAPTLASRSFTSGSCNALTVSACSFAMTSLFTAAGAKVEIRVADTPPETLEQTRLVGADTSGRPLAKVTVLAGTSARFLVVWITELPKDAKGYRVGVMESGRRWPDEDIPKTQWDLPHFIWMPGAELYGIQRIEYLDEVDSKTF